jgi:predicted PurR-regulated permease PerM
VKLLTKRGLVTRRGSALGIIAAVGLLIVVPIVLGSGFAVVQAARAARVVSDGVGAVQASLAKPDDKDLRARVPSGAWLWVRDAVVEMDREHRQKMQTARSAASEDSSPGVGPEPLADADMQSDTKTVAQLVLSWIREHGTEVSTNLTRSIVGGGRQAVGAAIGTVTSIGYFAFAIGLTAFFFYFFSTGWGKVIEFWHGLIPDANKARVSTMVTRMDRVIAGFVRGRVTICFVLAVFMTIAYWVAGVPAPLVLGPIVGCLFIVPFVHFVGVPIAMLLMWLDPLGIGGSTAGSAAWWAFQREWWWIIGAPIGVYVCAQLLDDWVLTPTIQGKTTDLSIPLILFASIAGGALAGIYGLLIAIPAAACLKIVLDEVVWPKFKAWAAGRERDFLPIGRE